MKESDSVAGGVKKGAASGSKRSESTRAVRSGEYIG